MAENPEFKAMMTRDGFELTMTEHELNGPARFVADKLATSDQCQMLIKLTNVCVFIFINGFVAISLKNEQKRIIYELPDYL